MKLSRIAFDRVLGAAGLVHGGLVAIPTRTAPPPVDQILVVLACQVVPPHAVGKRGVPVPAVPALGPRFLGEIFDNGHTHGLLIVKFEIHAVVNFIIFEFDVVLEDGVPLFQDDLVGAGSGLGGDQFFEVPNGVIFVAFDANFLAETIVDRDFDHSTVFPGKSKHGNFEEL